MAGTVRVFFFLQMTVANDSALCKTAPVKKSSSCVFQDGIKWLLVLALSFYSVFYGLLDLCLVAAGEFAFRKEEFALANLHNFFFGFVLFIPIFSSFYFTAFILSFQ